MYRFFFITLCFLSINLNGQGIHFFEGTWEEVLATAKEEKKEIFVDIYTTWCGPCKQLDKSTFKDAKLAAYINEHYIAFKIDAEHSPDRGLAYAFGIGGYPVMIFFDENGIQKIQARGFKKPQALLGIAKFAKNELETDYDLLKSFETDIADIKKEELLWLLDHFDEFHTPQKSMYLAKLHNLLTDEEKEDMKYRYLAQYPFLSEGLKSYYIQKYTNPSLFNPDRDALIAMRYNVGRQVESEYVLAFSAKDKEAFMRALTRRMDYAVKTGQVDADERYILEEGYLDEYIFKQENRDKGY